MSIGTSTNGTDGKKVAAGAEDTVEKLREDVSALAREVKTVWADVSGVAKERGAETLRQGKHLAEKAGKSVKDAAHTTEETIRKHPLAAIGVAVGVGVLLAVLTTRKS